MNILNTFYEYLVFGKDRKGETVICRDFETLEEAEKFAVDHIDEAKITIFKKEKEMERPLTLREYMQENASGAYHNFIFEIAKLKCNVIGVDDFETYYNKDLLDRFYVLSDAEESYGDNCENYGCDHHLTLQMIPVTK